MKLILKEDKLPQVESFPALFVASCRSGKSFRMQELAKDKEVIYILTNAHKMEDDSFKLCGCFNEGDVFKQTNIYTNSSKVLDGIHNLVSIEDYILFAKENNVFLFLDESNVKNTFLEFLKGVDYLNVVASTQSFQDLKESNIDKNHFNTFLFGRVNDLYSVKEVADIINMSVDDYRMLPAYSFVMVDSD